MAGGDRLFKPSERGRRDPVSDAKENGAIVNPPRYAKFGGFINAAKGFARNMFGIRRPGGGAK